MATFRNLDDIAKSGTFLDNLALFPPIFSDEFTLPGRSRRHIELYRKMLTAYLHTKDVTRNGQAATVRDVVEALAEGANTSAAQDEGSIRDLYWQGRLIHVQGWASDLPRWESVVSDAEEVKLSLDDCRGKRHTMNSRCPQLRKTGRLLSSLLYELDAIDQAHEASAKGYCRAEFAHSTCETLGKAAQEHVPLYRKSRELCSRVGNLAGGIYACTETASVQALDLVASRLEAKGPHAAIQEMKSAGLIVMPGSGHWPAVLLEDFNLKYVEGELARVRRLGGDSLSGYVGRVIARLARVLPAP